MFDGPLFTGSPFDGASAQLWILALAGLVAGFVNSVAGAGSLLTLPALIFTGLDPSAANATNRLSVLAQVTTAAVTFRRGGLKGVRRAAKLSAVAAAFSAAGAFLAARLDESTLRLAIACAMVVFLVLSFVPAGATEAPGAERSHETKAGGGAGLYGGFAAIGFYAGFLQAGVGVLVLLFLSRFYRVSLVDGNLIKVVAIFVFTVIALVVFYVEGELIDVWRGLVLSVSGALGAWLGARSALRRGERWVRGVLVISVGLAAAKLTWDVVR